MLFENIRNFSRGYLLIEVKSEFLERFINMAIYQNNRIWDIRKTSESTMELKIDFANFKNIRGVCKKTKSTIKIIKKHGIPIAYMKYKKRYMLLIGILFFIAFFCISSQFIWAIEINGLKTQTYEEVVEDLEAVGLHEGVYKNKFDLNVLKEKILLQNKELSWAWVTIKGNTAIINVTEKVKQPYIVPKDSPCNIIALKTGIIKKVVAKTGKSMIQLYDTVFPGEILISGIVDSEVDGVPTRYIHSTGGIYARTWYEKVGEFNLYKEYKVYSGNEKKFSYLKVFGKKMLLFFEKNLNFHNYDIETRVNDLKIGDNNHMGMSITTEIVKEFSYVKVPISIEQATEKAKKSLFLEIEKEIALDSEKVTDDFYYQMIDDDTFIGTLRAEYVEQIGVKQEISKEMDVIE